MRFDEAGTHPFGPEQARPVTWFSDPTGEQKPEPAWRNGNSGTDEPTPPAGPRLYVPAEREPLTLQRLAALRQWLAAGGHNTPEIAEEVARRILESGDL